MAGNTVLVPATGGRIGGRLSLRLNQQILCAYTAYTPSLRGLRSWGCIQCTAVCKLTLGMTTRRMTSRCFRPAAGFFHADWCLDRGLFEAAGTIHVFPNPVPVRRYPQ